MKAGTLNLAKESIQEMPHLLLPYIVVVVQSLSHVSNSSAPCGLQHARLPCPSLSRGVCSDSCPLSPSHPMSSPSPPALNLSQHQGPFQWVSSSHQVAKVLKLQLQQLLLNMNNQCWFPLRLVKSKGLSRVFSNTTVRKHQFFSAQPSL